MGSDMVVALKDASANGTTLFALNHHAAPSQRHSLQHFPGHFHEPGQLVPIPNSSLPQVRQTHTVLGLQAHGDWGLAYGINEHRVAVGMSRWQSRLKENNAWLGAGDLVRLALERSKSALNAVDVITDLLQRHGQKSDSIYMIADADEAFVLETCGHYWALLDCCHTRAVTGAAMIRQDWSRLAPGLASNAIEHGWWPDDGSKIDFVRALGSITDHSKNAQKSWGRASLTLSQQQGAIELHFLRRMLADHHSSNRELRGAGTPSALASSFCVELQRSELPIVVWLAFGPPRTAVYFPICLAGELPAAFGVGQSMMTTIEDRTAEFAKLPHNKDGRDKLVVAMERMQVRFDQDAEEFLGKAQDYQHHGKPHLVPAIATEMMHQHVDLFDKEYRRLFGVEDQRPPVPAPAEEMLFYA